MPVPSLTSSLLCGPQSLPGSPQRGFDELLRRSLPNYGKEDIQIFRMGEASELTIPRNLGVKTLCPQWAPGEELLSGLGWPLMKAREAQRGEGEERSLAVLGLQRGSFRVLLPFFSKYPSWKLVLINNELDYVRIKLHRNSNLLGLFLAMSLDNLQLKKGCLG